MKRWSVRRMIILLALAAVFWAIVAAACLFVGSTGAGIPASWQFHERYPRVLIASLIGAALAASGVVYQAVLRNPLADPYLLGVSSGAALASYIWRLPLAGTFLAMIGLTATSATQQAFAFVGAIASVTIVFGLSSRRGRLEPLTLLLVGVIVNVVNGAIFLLLAEIRRDITRQASFIVGGIPTTLSTIHVVTAAMCVAVGWIALMILSGDLNVARLDEAEAESLGVRVNRFRWIAMVLASLMTASVVAISGPIGFIGLVCPHLSRLLVGNDQRRLLPVATALGAGMLAIADAASRWASQDQLIGTELPVGILTAMLGGPFFLLLLYQSRKSIARTGGTE